jgi:hypothetical protein
MSEGVMILRRVVAIGAAIAAFAALGAACGGAAHVTTCNSDSDCEGSLKCIESYQVTRCDDLDGCSCDIVQKICTHGCTTDADCSDALFGSSPSTCEAATTCSSVRNLCN